jgi:hypothetical protein
VRPVCADDDASVLSKRALSNGCPRRRIPRPRIQAAITIALHERERFSG